LVVAVIAVVLLSIRIVRDLITKAPDVLEKRLNEIASRMLKK